MNELRELYEKARTEIQSYQDAAKIANVSAREAKKDSEHYKQDARKATRSLARLTQKQKATAEVAVLAGAAGTAVTILYQLWHVVGFPGGAKFMVWWEHEAVYGVLVWCVTVSLGWAYRTTHDDGE
jgi:hypothetical protein